MRDPPSRVLRASIPVLDEFLEVRFVHHDHLAPVRAERGKHQVYVGRGEKGDGLLDVWLVWRQNPVRLTRNVIQPFCAGRPVVEEQLAADGSGGQSGLVT